MNNNNMISENNNELSMYCQIFFARTLNPEPYTLDPIFLP